jgi:hypothetical protein
MILTNTGIYKSFNHFWGRWNDKTEAQLNKFNIGY